jgi:hypothetical protein
MRDFRDAKAMAHALRANLAAKGHKVSNSESLELIAKALGEPDWNTLSAAIKAAAKEAPPDPTGPTAGDASSGTTKFGPDLTASLHRAVRLANQRRHQYATLEHLLLALLDDPDVVAAIDAGPADRAALAAALTTYVDTELGALAAEHGEGAAPTQGFQRVIQRAVIWRQTVGGALLNGADVLASIFSEPNSHAVYFLEEHGVTRYDVVNFIGGQGVL